MQENHINLRFSFQFFMLFVIMFTGSVLIIMTLAVHWEVKFFLLFLVLGYGWYILWQAIFLKNHGAIVKITLTANKEWQLSDRQQRRYSATLRGDSTVTRWVCILRFNLVNRRWPKTCVIFRDMMSKDEYRRLLVRLY